MSDWQALERKVKEIARGIDRERLKEARIVLFGAGLNGSVAYESLNKNFNIYAFTDNNSKLWGVKKKEFLLFLQMNLRI